LFFLAATFILVSNFAMAQNRFGVAGGVSFSNMKQEIEGLGESQGLYQAGVVFGVLADLPMEKNGSFQAGLNFIQKGVHNKKTIGNPNQVTKLTLNYIEVPLNILFRLPKTPLTIGGGPAFAIGTGGNGTITTNGTPVKEDVNFGDDIDDDFKGLDVGLNGQIAWNLKSGLFVDANYTYGINSLYKYKSPEGKLYNRSASLRVGYLFTCKKKEKK
jgi:hypothetical protein